MPTAARIAFNFENPDAPIDVPYKERKETGQLARDYGQVPFDVMQTTTEMWATRKKGWITEFNLRGELGRDSDIAATGTQIKSYPGQERLQAMQRADIVPGGGGPNSVRRRAAGNVSNLYGPAADSNSVLTEDQQRALGAYSAPNGSVVSRGEGTSSLAGTSIFDPVLCEVSYKWWCPRGGSILDPFAGGATRGIVAAALGYRYTGIEIRQGQVDANRAQVPAAREAYKRVFWEDIAAGTLPPEMIEPEWIVGDSTNIDDALPIGEEYDMCFSCPPYYNLEVYSATDGDGSRVQTYPEFMQWYTSVYAQCVARVREGRFVCITVGDVRDKGNVGEYWNFCADTQLMFARTLGLHTYNQVVLYTAIGSLPIRTAAAFPAGRKLGHAYQQMFVFWKGPNKSGAVKDALGELKSEDFAVTTGSIMDVTGQLQEE